MTDRAWLALWALSLLLSCQAAGAALFWALPGRALKRSAAAIRRGGVRAALTALAVLLLQALLWPAHLAGDFSGMTSAPLLRLYLGSSAALGLALRIAGVSGVALTLRRAAPRPVPTALAGLITAGSFLLTGHTAVSAHRLLLAPLLLAHVTIVSFWFGSLWPLARASMLETPTDAAVVLAAFSRVAGWAVPALALAGIGMALLLLPGYSALGRPYGLLLLTKLVLFALLMGLAALNRLRLAPALARGGMRAPARLRRSIALEYALIGVVFAVTSVMSEGLAPAGD
jgi:copper resistance protein D